MHRCTVTLYMTHRALEWFFSTTQISINIINNYFAWWSNCSSSFSNPVNYNSTSEDTKEISRIFWDSQVLYRRVACHHTVPNLEKRQLHILMPYLHHIPLCLYPKHRIHYPCPNSCHISRPSHIHSFHYHNIILRLETRLFSVCN